MRPLITLVPFVFYYFILFSFHHVSFFPLLHRDIPTNWNIEYSGKHFVTASYVSEDMRNLDAKAREKGVILLNEVGLDPGIDHMVRMYIRYDCRKYVTNGEKWCDSIVFTFHFI